jgi:hypothetical protein
MFHGEVRCGECHESLDLRTSSGGSIFVAMRNLFGDSWLIVAASTSRGDSIGEVQSPTIEGETPRFGLNWLCLAMVLLKVLCTGGKKAIGPGLD